MKSLNRGQFSGLIVIVKTPKKTIKRGLYDNNTIITLDSNSSNSYITLY